jgi:parallel beta-helix repeat protein
LIKLPLKFLGLVLLISFGHLPSIEAATATYYVATTGTDSNPGSQSQPFSTIKKAITVLSPGDTVYVRAGTYAEGDIDGIPGGTSWASAITVAAYPGETVTIRPNAGALRVFTLTGSSTQYIVIDGFILDAINMVGDVIKITWAGSSGNAAHHIRVKNSEVKNAWNQGILVTSGSHSNELINLNIHHNGRGNLVNLVHGVYIQSASNLIEGCVIHDNLAYGVTLYNGVGGVSNNTIRNNRVYNNGSGGIEVGDGSDNLIYNNLTYANTQAGIFLYDGAINTKIYNNTVYLNNAVGILIGSGSQNAHIQNNIIYANTSLHLSDSGTGTQVSSNLIGIDPKFVDSSAFNLKLQVGSPAIDAGLALSAVPFDFADVQRPQGGGYDIGAFEYQSGTASIASPKNLRVLP